LRYLRFSKAVDSCRPFTMVAMLPIRRSPPDELRLATINQHPRDSRIVFIEHDNRYLLDATVQFPISVSGVNGIRLTSFAHSRPVVIRHRLLKTKSEFCLLLWFPCPYICYLVLNYPKHSQPCATSQLTTLAFPCGSQVQNASSFIRFWNPLQFMVNSLCCSVGYALTQCDIPATF
jgi:hypothetical protein